MFIAAPVLLGKAVASGVRRAALVGRGAEKEQVRLKIKDFLQYCHAEHHGKRDDSPL